MKVYNSDHLCRITGATRSISPWDKEYCIKVNVVNKYMIDRCEAQLPATCSTFGG